MSNALKSTIECDYDGQKYSQSVICKINAFKSGSESGSGSLSVSCTSSPTSAKTGVSVNFSASTSKSGFSSGKCNTLKYL